MSQPKKALVIDDEPDVICIYEKILRGANFVVESASNGAEAGFKLGRQQYDVVVTDVNMPYSDGIAVIQNMKEGVMNNRTPVIVCSGQIDRSVLASLLKRGIKKILTKPIKSADLIKAVNEVMEQKQK